MVIVGGGPTGLLLSALLSSYSIPSTLLESKPRHQVSNPDLGHPQAHYLNLRSMEIMKHHLPVLYDDVVRAMPPVEEWEGFGFGHSVLGRQIGRVVHPVRDLRVGMEGNGWLVGDGEEDVMGNNKKKATQNGRQSDQRVSPCDPGHLAQNKFASLLLDAAERAPADGAEILHGMTVDRVVDDGTLNNTLKVQTKCGQKFHPIVVVAADGASSSIRQSFAVPMLGRPVLQHLISVHFRILPPLTAKLAAEATKVNMLHFVFNESLVGCFVCHDLQEGEWVLQVPFFAPFQTADRFSTKRVKELVIAGIGIALDDVSAAKDVEVLTHRPWTMSSTVAESYLAGPSKRVVLAGDAAHAFPPAGGFGMNTGLQDAHNLAWRLALHLSSNGDSNKDRLNKALHRYQSERRPVASQNAALSVRNYNRTLEVAKACYLNADHPALLVKAMSAPPLSFVPMDVRMNMFDAAVKVATLPLGGLARAGNPYGERIKDNVRDKLGRGDGLPLLFPRYEIGFGYDLDSGLGEGDDTAGFFPKLDVGRRLPHVELEVHMPGSSEDKDLATISLTDIGSQLRHVRKEDYESPRFTAIIVGVITRDDVRDFDETMASVSSTTGAAIDTVAILPNQEAKESNSNEECGNAALLLDSRGNFHSKIDFEGIILVRPDGHVASLSPLSGDSKRLEEELIVAIQQDL